MEHGGGPPAPETVVALRHAARTDVGRKRAVNEDSLLARDPVFIVADGMGGHEAGDRASAAVVQEFLGLAGRELVLADVTAAVDRAHAAVRHIADGTQRGAGSTLTGAVLIRHDAVLQWLVVNVGDSRVYQMRGNNLAQLTIDHSLAQQLVSQGKLRTDEVATFAKRNVITRAVGAADSPADYWLVPVVSGDRLLVCSDGLTGELVDEAILAGLTLGGGTEQTVDLLLARALENGGRDNVSLIVVDVITGGAAPTDEPSTGSFVDSDTATTDTRLDDTAEVPGRRGRSSVK
ncbi:protein phosphatase [Glaciihabitans tibetensis]|uniref:Protein phosphatase n=1 Tax=Glaciihabitans tibetensis TaxID=1266600 RepID=A0A2T0VD91_9MICO|nr:protein phosphatase 2C domain-containing protein [Glaciihabitans tibetensis]PRY68104.1 protein phosphatase [Glaciihabitans tibetensis]